MLFLCLLIPPTPFTTTGAIDFERLSLADALRLQNQVVTAQFIVAHEPYEIAGLTVVGPGYWEGEERLVALRGLVDVGLGDRIVVRGRLCLHQSSRLLRYG
jgi:hypothetical protein